MPNITSAELEAIQRLIETAVTLANNGITMLTAAGRAVDGCKKLLTKIQEREGGL